MAEVTGLRNDSLPYPLYGVPFGITFPILDADGDLVTAAAALDSERSLNGDTFADCTNEATEIATSSGIYYLLLTAAEMTADVLTIIVKTTTTGAKTTVLTLYPRKMVNLRTGTAQAGAATTITLDASAAGIDDYYNGCVIYTTGGTGPNQARMIGDYVGSTKVATVAGPNWATTPDSTTTFAVYLSDARQILQNDNVAWLGTALPSSDTAGYPKVTIKDGTGTGEIDTTSGGVLVSAIAANAITATAINADAITNAKIADDAIAVENIKDAAITAAKIATDAITNAKIAADAIGASEIADGAIDANTFAAGAITAAAIATDAIGAAELAADAVAEIADQVWDEAQSGHVAAGSFGQGNQAVFKGAVASGASGSVTLGAASIGTALSAVDDYYNGLIVMIVAGLGAGQFRAITDYVGATKVVTIDGNWAVTPDNTSKAIIVGV